MLPLKLTGFTALYNFVVDVLEIGVDRLNRPSLLRLKIGVALDSSIITDHWASP